jgi:hypothetical protein
VSDETIIGCLTAMAMLVGFLASRRERFGASGFDPIGECYADARQRHHAYNILKHDETRRLAELDGKLEKQGFYRHFPPPVAEVVSWNIAMGIGQVVTLRFPASRLRGQPYLRDHRLTRYHAEFYATYDYKAVGIGQHNRAQ